MTPLLLTLWATSLADPLVVTVEGGRVDWGRGVLCARAASSGGSGLLTSPRTLEQEAWLRLESQLHDQAALVRVSSDLLAGDLMAGEDPLALRLSEGLQTWRVTTTRYRRSGQVELEAELVLRDWLRPALSGWVSADRPRRQEQGPTGLVVDARGLAVTPALVPRLLAPDQSVLFGPGHLVLGQLSTHPPVVWVTDPADALATSHAGTAPVFVGIGAVVQGSDLVLEPAQLAPRDDLDAALSRGRVVVVVDP